MAKRFIHGISIHYVVDSLSLTRNDTKELCQQFEPIKTIGSIFCLRCMTIVRVMRQIYIMITTFVL